jgi:hypothetical protein
LEDTQASLVSKEEGRSDLSGHAKDAESKPLVSTNTGPYRNFSNLTVPLLKSNVLNVVQKKTGVLKSTTAQESLPEPTHSSTNVPSEPIQTAVPSNMNSSRVVPKLNRPSSLLSQIQSGPSLMERALSIASSGKRSIDSVGNVESQTDKRSKESHLEVLNEDTKEDISTKVRENISDSKTTEPVKTTSKAFQSLADIRKGLALKKKPTSGSSTNNESKNDPLSGAKLDLAPIPTASQATTVKEETHLRDQISIPSIEKHTEIVTAENVPLPASPHEGTTAVHVPTSDVGQLPTAQTKRVQGDLEEGEIPPNDLMEEQQPDGLIHSDLEDGEITDESIQLTGPLSSNDEPALETPVEKIVEQTVMSDRMDDQTEELPVPSDANAPSNIYKGSQTSFLTKEAKPTSFLQGAVVDKPKPAIKALEQAQLAAKKVIYVDRRNKKNGKSDKK